MVIRVWIKTKPAQQWHIERELRRRARTALAQHKVGMDASNH
jgi:hypothetical protein